VRYRALAPHHTPRFAPIHPVGRSVRTLPLPGYRQARNYSCGYACALMVARYFRPEVRGRDLFDRLGTGLDGTRQTAIVRELRADGLRANVRYDVDFARLCREIDRNKLVIGYLFDIDHWVVLYGYGLGPDRVFVADPRPMEACEQPWERYADRLRDFGIVCSDPASQVIALPPVDRADPRPPPDPQAASDRDDGEPEQLTFDFALP
jgi:hypothetical protein